MQYQFFEAADRKIQNKISQIFSLVNLHLPKGEKYIHNDVISILNSVWFLNEDFQELNNVNEKEISNVKEELKTLYEEAKTIRDKASDLHKKLLAEIHGYGSQVKQEDSVPESGDIDRKGLIERINAHRKLINPKRLSKARLQTVGIIKCSR